MRAHLFYTGTRAPTGAGFPGMAAWLLLAGLLAGCKPAVGASEPAGLMSDSAFGEDLEPLPGRSIAPPAEEPAAAPAPEPEPEIGRTRHGMVARADLDAVLDRGPGAFLGGFSLAPHFRERRFAGWQIVALTVGAAALARIDLRPGDIVASINGHPVERPRHLSDLWAALRSADAIVVRVERAGQPFVLHFEVVNDNLAAP